MCNAIYSHLTHQSYSFSDSGSDPEAVSESDSYWNSIILGFRFKSSSLGPYSASHTDSNSNSDPDSDYYSNLYT